MPTISVIIPFYNRVKWLSGAIQSVFAQTYQDFEIILVDDGSSEDINELAELSDKRIRYIRQQNKGPAAARNAGLDLARGRYVAFLDADDVFLPTKLEKQVACMESNPDILLCHTSYQRINAEGLYLEEVNSGAFSGKVYPKILYYCPIHTSTVMIRRKNLGRDLRFEESARICEDVIFLSMFAKESMIIGINEALTSVRIDRRNAAFNPQARTTGNMNVIKYLIKRDPDISWVSRRKALSLNYMGMALNYLEMNQKGNFFRFASLSIMQYPPVFPYTVMFRLSSALHLKPPERFRRILGRLPC